MRAEGFDDAERQLRCQLFEDELYGIDDTIERVRRLLQGGERRLRSRQAPAAAARAAVGRQVELVILLKRGLEEYSHTDAGALYAIQGCPVHESPLHLVPHTLRAAVPRRPTASRSRASCARTARAASQHEFGGDFMQMPVERIFISEAGRVGVGTYAPHDPTTADIADLVGSVDLSKVSEFGDEGDPRAWSWSGAVYRREPRHARDDRDPQGEARVPVSAAHAHAGEERQGVALPADPPRRDDPRAHQPRRVPQVPAGARRTRRCSTAWSSSRCRTR